MTVEEAAIASIGRLSSKSYLGGKYIEQFLKGHEYATIKASSLQSLLEDKEKEVERLEKALKEINAISFATSLTSLLTNYIEPMKEIFELSTDTLNKQE